MFIPLSFAATARATCQLILILYYLQKRPIEGHDKRDLEILKRKREVRTKIVKLELRYREREKSKGLGYMKRGCGF